MRNINTISDSFPFCFKIPLLVGVTGHRDLRADELPVLEKSVKDILANLRSRFPSTPIVVLSPLAEGADQLVAKIALDFRLPLAVPLPMPANVYQADFQTSEQRQNFRDLLNHASGHQVLPFVTNVDIDQILQPGPERDLQYAQVGEWLAEKSNVLIAIWDGVDNEKIGGTGSVVKRRLCGAPPARASFYERPTGREVFHIMAGRTSTTAVANPGKITELRPSELQVSWTTLSDQIESCNRDYDQSKTYLSNHLEQSAEWLFPSASLPPETTNLGILRSQFAAMDVQANHKQLSTDRTWIGLYLLGWSAVMAIELYTGPWPYQTTVAIYFLLLTSAWCLFGFARRKLLQEKHLDYRAIAEALRVQFYWKYGGITRNVADEFLVSQQSVLAWIPSAVQSINVMADFAMKIVNPPSIDSAKKLRDMWIEDQRKYYKRAAQRDSLRARRRDLASRCLFAVGLALTAIQAFLDPNPVIMLLMAMAPVTAALLSSHAERLGDRKSVV